MSKDEVSSPLPQLGQDSQKQVHYLPRSTLFHPQSVCTPTIT